MFFFSLKNFQIFWSFSAPPSVLLLFSFLLLTIQEPHPPVLSETPVPRDTNTQMPPLSIPDKSALLLLASVTAVNFGLALFTPDIETELAEDVRPVVGLAAGALTAVREGKREGKGRGDTGGRSTIDDRHRVDHRHLVDRST